MALSAILPLPSRRLSLSGVITYLTGATRAFNGGDALSFSLSEGAAGGGMLGGVFSASCSLTLNDKDGAFTLEHSPYGAQVRVRLCQDEDSAPLAVFTVTKAAKRENDPRLILTGQDALGTAFNGLFEDGLVYPQPLSAIARAIAAQAGFSLTDVSFPNADFMIPERPDWGDISLRQALSCVSCAAGCFVMLNREGRLEIKPLVSAMIPREIGPGVTLSSEIGGRGFGPLAALTVVPKGAKRGDAPIAVSLDNAAPGRENTLTVSGNPLFPANGSHTLSLCRALLDALAGYTLSAAQVLWRGDPAVHLGDRVRFRDHRDVCTDTAVTAQTLSFQQGFSMRTECVCPEAQTAAGRLFTPSGALNAALLEGSVNGALIRDGSIAASSLMAGSVTAQQLASGSVTAEKISAGAVTADKLNAAAVTAEKIASGAVTAEKLSSGALDALYARFSQADIDWANIASLQSAVAEIAQAQIGSADVDWARIKDLVNRRAIITQGTAGELYIARLAVTEANLLSLTVGEIMVKGQDGGMYALTVDSEGGVSAQRKQVGNDDVMDHALSGDEKLMEGSVTARSLNAQDIFGENALIRQLIAETLDVDALFAREAVVQKLNALDITGNQSIRIWVQEQEQMSAYLHVTADGLEIGRVGDAARFRADNRTLEVTNVKSERLGVAQQMGLPEEWAFIATRTGLGLKYLG